MRIYRVRGAQVGRVDTTPDGPWNTLCRRVRDAGFNALLTDPLWKKAQGAGALPAPLDPDSPDPRLDTGPDLAGTLARLSDCVARHDLQIYMDLVLDRVATDAAAHAGHPDWYRPPDDDPARDPRTGLAEHGIRYLRVGPLPQAFLHGWSERLARWLEAGIAGFRVDAPHRIGAGDWQALLAPLRAAFPAGRFLAWTPGLDPQQLGSLRAAGFDAVFSSLPWWDFKSDWLAEEHARLRTIAPVIASPPGAGLAQDDAQALRGLWAAAISGDGILGEDELEARPQAYAQMDAWLQGVPPGEGLRVAGGRDGRCSVMVRDDAGAGARVLLANPAAHGAA
ncbi:DUF3416 domain-containing protein, partial [Bordetella petrii]|nr:DUF3416 domain-containing protein [Bordetella petrii]